MKLILLIIFGVILLSSHAFAATYAVNGTGNSCFAGAAGNFSTIQSAINAASNGDTIIICANGTSGYGENVFVNRSINLYGNESGVGVYAQNSIQSVFIVQATYVNISNFTVQGASGATAAAISIDNRALSTYANITNVTIRNSNAGIYTAQADSGNRFTSNTIYNCSSGFVINSINNFLGTNLVFNTSIAFQIQNSSNNLTSNTALNNSILDFYLNSNSHNSILTSNNANNSAYGFYLESSNNILILNTAYNNSNGGFSLSSNNNNTLTNNTAYNNSYGFYLNQSTTSTLASNAASNNSISGFILLQSSNNTLTNNTASNNSNDGFYLLSSNYTTLISNIAYNNTYHAFDLNLSYVNNLTNNTAYSNNGTGFKVQSSDNNSLTSNTAYNNVEDGFSLDSSNSNNLTSNTAYNNSEFGFAVVLSSNNIFTNNTAYLQTSSGYGAFAFFGASAGGAYNNTAYNSITGFLFLYNSSITSFEGNNLTNSTQYGVFLSDNGDGDYGPPSSLTFSGNNGIYNTPSSGKEVYAFNSTLSTNGYNITTSNMSFALNSTFNVSIKVLDLSNVSGTNYTTVTTITGVSFSSAKVVQNSNGNYYWLNVTNTTPSASFSPKFFYNSSDLTGYSTTYLGIGSTNTSGTWIYNSSSTVNTSESSVYLSGISSFSYFAPLVYSPSSDSTPNDNDQSNPSNPSLTISYSTACEQNTITVKSNEEKVSGVTVKVDGDNIGTTDSNGQVTFAGCGKEVIISATKSGYTHDYLTATLVACSQCTSQPECTLNSDCNSDEFCSNNVCVQVSGTCGYISNHAWVSYSCCVNSDCGSEQKCKEHVCIATEQPPSQNNTNNTVDMLANAQSAISNAEAAINKALSEGKDVTSAKSVLIEAKAAFEAKNYVEATSFAYQALNFANSAPKTVLTPNPTIVQPPQPASKFDFSILLLLFPVGVVGLAVVAYFLLRKKLNRH